ncbi:branched-chain amino acid transport system permease protein [Rhodoligotrophos appendicifer]|uniref:branched-chain amino acid ABC transporter permease n=1 Tax=Rhodoligotrophos appendicifer TaxID=987056 RepID=UPI0011859820|nr:branched-chain amino acid ABC transporter permease [Rhodoligotrophos appendicifer]
MNGVEPVRLLGWVACAAVVLAWPAVANEQWLTVGAFAAIAVIGALSLQILTGLTGLISLGQAAFFGIGAYVASTLGPQMHPEVDSLLGNLPFPLDLIAGNQHGWPLVLGLLLAGLCSGFVGLLLAPAAIRLSGIYLAIVTLGMIFAAQYLFIHWDWLTGGAMGVALSAPAFGNFSFEGDSAIGDLVIGRSLKLYYLAVALATLSGLSVLRLKHSKTGRALQAIRDNETAAAMNGINITYYKIASFVAADFMAGIAGALYGTQFGFALPETWDLNLSVMFVAMIIIGGLGLVRGAVIGALFITCLPPILREILGDDVHVLGLNAPQLNQVVFGLAIVLFLVAAPGGLARLKISKLFRVNRAQKSEQPNTSHQLTSSSPALDRAGEMEKA